LVSTLAYTTTLLRCIAGRAGLSGIAKEVFMRRSSALVLTLVLIGPLSAASPVRAAAILIGSSNSFDVEPFGWDDGDTPSRLFQQLYAGSSFGIDPILITQLTFFLEPLSWEGRMFYTGEQLYLSTSPQSHSSPGTSFAANRGTDFTQVFSGTFSTGFDGWLPPVLPCPECTETTLTFNITPFLYDPTAGDLLLEVAPSYHYSDNADLIYFESGSNSNVAVVDNHGGFITPEPRVRTNYGLLTQFTYEPQVVPEPASLTLFGAGFAALLGLRRQRSSRRGSKLGS
jgi:PEP-CTERM motif-containing protein